MGAEILAFFLIAAAVRGLVQQTKRDLAEWRHRPPPAKGKGKRSRVTAGATGYWGHQAAHAFPTARHGLMDGWNRGREAHHRARRAIAQGRAEHAEGKAELHPELEEFRARRRKALQELWEKQRWQPEPEPEQKPEQKQVPEQRKPEDETYPYGPPPPYAGYRDKDGNLVPPKGREQGKDRKPEPQGSEPKHDDPGQPDQGGQRNGDEPVSETSYAGVKTRMTADQANAEQRQAEANAASQGCEARVADAERAKQWAQTTSEEMQALEVDGQTLGAMADHLSALDAALQAERDLMEAAQRANDAWNRAVESASTVIHQLDASGHGNLQEAHDNAAGQGAKKEFYTKGQ